MKIFLLLVISSAAIYAQGTGLTGEGPVFDSVGHLSSYRYSDGTTELYSYDAQGRMIRFTGRDGRVTRFKYGSDGSMIVVNPDGTERLAGLSSPTR